MNKSRMVLSAIAVAMSLTLLGGCTNSDNSSQSSEGGEDSSTISSGSSSTENSMDSSSSSVAKESIIDLKSEKNQKLKVGEEVILVYLLKDRNKEVGFRSSDESIVTVDEFANVKGVGIGEAIVTIYVIGDESDKVEVNFDVQKSFFLATRGYYNGSIDFNDEDNGIVKIKGDQSQILVNEKSNTWYFKVKITRKGFANADKAGRIGVGSFLVDKDHPIGNNMFWYGFKPMDADYSTVSPYYGGWRYAEGVTNDEHDIDSAIKFDSSKVLEVEIIRKGKMHYFQWTSGDETIGKIKQAVAVPYFGDETTYPGVYSQNQILDITDFEATSDPAEVDMKLDAFQKAESVSINCIDNRLIHGKSYQLSSTVKPSYTPNKDVNYALDEEKEGVSLTEEGLLTIAEGVTGRIYVKASAKNNPNANEIKIFQAISAPDTGTGIVNEGMVKAKGATFNGNTIQAVSDSNYFPLNIKDSNWVVSIKAKYTDSSMKNGKLGILSSADGYMDYLESGFKYSATETARKIENYRLNEEESASLDYARSGASVMNEDTVLTVIKKGAKQYIVEDNRLLGAYDSIIGETTPVIFTNNVKADIEILSVDTGEAKANEELGKHPFFTGGNVARNGETYDLAKMNFTGNNMNWPPVNGFANGLKNKDYISGDFDISFTLSNIDPLGNDNLDSKILVYLNSETTTCSIQLIIKGTRSNPTYALCPNYDDATWTEYAILDEYGIDFTQPVDIKIEKRLEGCKFYLNGVSIFDGHTLWKNDNYDWSATSKMLPGIGTFQCGATIANPRITKVNN